MTRKEFQRRMRKLKSDSTWRRYQTIFTCYLIQHHIPQAFKAYCNIMRLESVDGGRGFVSAVKMCQDSAGNYLWNSAARRGNRANAILMFEQTVLAFEMYKEW